MLDPQMLKSRMLNPTPPAALKVGNETSMGVLALRVAVAGAVVAFFFAGVPLLNAVGVVEDYRVQLLGKYLCFALVALGADLIWGYTGLLSLCQALFFCVGGYVIAMHLSLPEGGGIYSVPQFLTFVYYGHADPLPPFWKLFSSGAFAVFAGLAMAAALGSLFGFFIFRSRVRGVYFSIITQAVAWGSWLLICQNEMLLGGTNGLTNFSKAFTSERGWIIKLYLLTAGLVLLGYLLCRAVIRSRAGRVMVAIRDKEMRLYFAGYKPYAFKVFAFTLAAVLGAVGGMLYPAQVGIITPQNMNVAASIEVVILVAVGGRGRLWGAIYGALLVLTFKSALSSDLPGAWPYFYGGLFIAVVLFFPTGFVGLWDNIEEAVATGGFMRPATAGNAVGSAAAVLLVTLFVVAEVLGMMPGFLQQALDISVRRGNAIAMSLAVAALAAWAAYSVVQSEFNQRRQGYVLLSLIAVVALTLVVLLFGKFPDPLQFKLAAKYLVLAIGLAFAGGVTAMLNRIGRRQARAEATFDVINVRQPSHS